MPSQPTGAPPQPSEQGAHSSSTVNACPDCRQNDQVQRVATVISGGSNSTLVGTSIHVESRTHLVRRFNIPLRPKTEAAPFLLLGTFFALLGFFAAARIFGSPFIAIAISVALVWPVRILASKVNRARRAGAADWDRRYQRLSNGYFCHRDDLAFEINEPHLHTPEEFSKLCFTR